MILQKLTDAELFRRKGYSGGNYSSPYFNDSQRQALKDAEKSRLEVLRIIGEPTAATLGI